NCGIVDGDGPDIVADRLAAGLREVGMAPGEWGQYLLHLFGIKDESGGIDALSPEAIKARTFETLRQLSLRGSRLRPLIFIVEDVHWIDKTSEEYLASLVERVWDGPGALHPHLLELKRLEFVYERPGTDESVYVFKHALTQDVAYEGLLTHRRQALHGAAGLALEELYADRLEEFYGALA